jgi:hypothetical protein
VRSSGLLAVVLALVALVLPASASASHDASGLPAEDFATGGANILELFISANVDAHSGPNGENPTGTARAARRSTYFVEGPVTCLAVSGNRATIAFAVQPGPVVPPGHVGHVVYVQDNGSPGSGRDIANERPSSEVIRTCSPPTDEQLVPFPFIPIRPQPIQSGEIVVHDFVPPPRPTSKEQCKNGGWRAFGFRNQGLCVAFVERGARPR